jgi:hypothetical protein
MSIPPLRSKVRRDKTETLVIHCSDYRFQGALVEFLNRVLNLNENYDLIAVPGGPLSLALLERHSDDSRAAWKWFRFFVERHGIRRLILIQHQDCAWYQEVPPGAHSPHALRQRQQEDLARISSQLRKSFPDLRVESYFAGWDAEDRITIEAFPA